MDNNKKTDIHSRLTFDIDIAKRAKSDEKKAALAYQALGAAEIAVEFGLITYSEFESYISSIFAIL